MSTIPTQAPEFENTDVAESFGFAFLRSGRTHVIAPRTDTRGGAGEESRPPASSGVIYTNRADMPSLEELLAQHEVVTAVLEREVPFSRSAVGSRRRETPFRARPSAGVLVRAIAACSIGAAVAGVGWALFALSVAPHALHANPYTALSLGLGGLLLLTAIVAAFQTPRDWWGVPSTISSP